MAICATRIHGIQFLPPPSQQAETFARIANLVAQVVGPAAKSVDVIKILMQLFGQQKSHYMEIFVVPGGQPASVLFRLRGSVDIAQGFLRLNEVFGGELVDGC